MLRSFFIYAISGGLNRAIPFFLLPIITRYLSPGEFGIWSIFQVIYTFCLPLIGLDSQANITRSFFRLEKNDIACLVGNLLVVISGTFALLLISLFLILTFFNDLFGLPTEWLYAIPFISFTNMINLYNLTVLRNRDRPKTYSAYEIGFTIFNFLTAIVLIIFADYGWQAMAWGRISAGLIFSLLGIWHLQKTGFFKINFDIRWIKEILRISIPLVPHALGGIIISLSDRLFIDNMLGKHDVGLYSLGYIFGSLVLLVTDSFNKAWSPWMYRQLAEIDMEKKKKIVKITYCYDFCIVLLALLLTAFSYRLIDLMIAPAYFEAKEYVLWVSLGLSAQGMYFMIFPYLVHIGKTNFLGLMTAIAALINLLGNYILIKINGAVGAAQSTLISYVLMFLVVWWYVRRSYPMPWFKLRHLRSGRV